MIVECYWSEPCFLSFIGHCVYRRDKKKEKKLGSVPHNQNLNSWRHGKKLSLFPALPFLFSPTSLFKTSTFFWPSFPRFLFAFKTTASAENPRCRWAYAPHTHIGPQSTYICRVQSCVWRLPKYWPPPLHPARVSFPRTKGGLHTRWVRGGWGVNILEDARHWIGLLQHNLSTHRPDHPFQAIRIRPRSSAGAGNNLVRIVHTPSPPHQGWPQEKAQCEFRRTRSRLLKGASREIVDKLIQYKISSTFKMLSP